MSDSGRQIGDCKHGNTKEWCINCIKDQRDELMELVRYTYISLSQLDSTPLIVLRNIRGKLNEINQRLNLP